MNLVRRLIVASVLVGCMGFSRGARAEKSTPFCAGQNCVKTRELLRDLCDYILKEKTDFSAIYVEGYYMRTLVDGYEIFGDQRYLEAAVAYSDRLLARQMPNGFWQTGYGPVYMADTGSALGLFIALYNHVDAHHQQEYLSAIEKYVASIQREGMIHPWGAFGTGWRKTEGDTLEVPLFDQYTLSSALTGGEIFTWMYHVTGKDEYRDIAHNALAWVLSTMRADGNIPHILAEEGEDWDKRDDPKMADKLFNTHTYGTQAYVGEGILSFDLYCDNKAWQRWIEQAVKPNIEFILRHQLADGTWSELGPKSWDRSRSIGIVDYLIWYYKHVDRDPRVASAVQRWDAYVLKPENAKAYGLLSAGADPGPKDANNCFNTLTSLTGRALADILSPGIDARW